MHSGKSRAVCYHYSPEGKEWHGWSSVGVAVGIGSQEVWISSWGYQEAMGCYKQKEWHSQLVSGMRNLESSDQWETIAERAQVKLPDFLTRFLFLPQASKGIQRVSVCISHSWPLWSSSRSSFRAIAWLYLETLWSRDELAKGKDSCYSLNLVWGTEVASPQRKPHTFGNQAWIPVWLCHFCW